jgi:hypothetical protein
MYYSVTTLLIRSVRPDIRDEIFQEVPVFSFVLPTTCTCSTRINPVPLPPQSCLWTLSVVTSNLTHSLTRVPSASWESAVGIVTTIRTERSRVRILAGKRGFSRLQNVQTDFANHPALYSIGTEALFRGQSGLVGILTTHLHLEPKSRMRVATRLLLLHAFMAQTTTTSTVCVVATPAYR